MDWLALALFVAFFNALMDFFIKLSSGKIHEGLGGFIVNLTSAIILLGFVIFAKIKGESVFQAKPGGVIYSLLAGIAIGIATLCFFKMFALGTNLSLGVPIVRLGIILIASLLGILLLKETISLRWAVGFVLSLIGLYLLATK